MHAAGSPRSALKCNVAWRRRRRKRRRTRTGFGDEARTIARFDIARISFVSRACTSLCFFPIPGLDGGGEGISPLQKFDRNTKSTRTDFSILPPLPAFLSFLSFPSASESVVIRRINPRREGGDELRFGANIATPFFPLWQGAKETRKGRSREWNRRGCADVFGLRTPKETGIDERLRRRPSENHFALAARIRREAKRRRVSETVREPPL